MGLMPKNILMYFIMKISIARQGIRVRSTTADSNMMPTSEQRLGRAGYMCFETARCRRVEVTHEKHAHVLTRYSSGEFAISSLCRCCSRLNAAPALASQ